MSSGCRGGPSPSRAKAGRARRRKPARRRSRREHGGGFHAARASGRREAPVEERRSGPGKRDRDGGPRPTCVEGAAKAAQPHRCRKPRFLTEARRKRSWPDGLTRLARERPRGRHRASEVRLRAVRQADNASAAQRPPVGCSSSLTCGSAMDRRTRRASEARPKLEGRRQPRPPPAPSAPRGVQGAGIDRNLECSCWLSVAESGERHPSLVASLAEKPVDPASDSTDRALHVTGSRLAPDDKGVGPMNASRTARAHEPGLAAMPGIEPDEGALDRSASPP